MEQASNYDLLDVFDYLDDISLKALYMTDERFKTLIQNSSKLMQKFSLDVNFENIDHAIRSVTKAKHYAIKVHCRGFINEPVKLDQLFQPVASDLKEVSLDDLTSDIAVHVLPHLCNVTEMKIRFDDNNLNESLTPMSFPNLKILKMRNSCELLKLIQNHCIEKLELRISENFMIGQATIINDFFRNCRNLKELTLMEFIPNIEEFPVNLVSLKVHQEALGDGFVLPLIQNNKNTLKNLSLKGCTSVGRIIDYVNEFCRLDELEIELVSGNYYFPYMFNNLTVKKLTIHVDNSQTIQVERFMAKFVNIETLAIYGQEHSFLIDRLMIISRLQKLKHLKIQSIGFANLPVDLKLTNIENFSINFIKTLNEARMVVNFLAICPNVRELNILDMVPDDFETPVIGPEELNNLLKNIEKFNVGDGFLLEDEIIDVLISHEDTLKEFRVDYFDQYNLDGLNEKVKRFNDTKIKCTVSKLNSDYDPVVGFVEYLHPNDPDRSGFWFKDVRDSSKIEL